MSRARVRTIAAFGLLSAAAAPAALAATTSHAKLWQNKSGTVVCGIKIHATSKPATEVLCGSKGIPRAPHGVGDPFVQIAAHGHPQLVLISQNSFVGTGTPKTLAKGATWSSLGVTCTIGAKTVKCENKSSHGFTIGNGKYVAF